MSFQKACSISELLEGTGRMVKVGGEEIALFNVKGKVYATESSCPHRGGPLAEGRIDGNIVTCPWHGWSFDVSTGAMTVSPDESLKTYVAKIEGSDILVEV